jgi:hypothetical protein
MVNLWQRRRKDFVQRKPWRKKAAGDVAQMAASPIELRMKWRKLWKAGCAGIPIGGLEKTALDKLMGDFTNPRRLAPTL